MRKDVRELYLSLQDLTAPLLVNDLAAYLTLRPQPAEIAGGGVKNQPIMFVGRFYSHCIA